MSLDEKVRELIAVGASIAVTNPPEVKYRISRARELGVQDDELKEAIEIGRLVPVCIKPGNDAYPARAGRMPEGGR
jgi:alkylhydroperoxidase/carboxymuconolactone decarboxylase family protein YurZ